ncbi:MAG: 6-pyruvoyl trahydropterin synthase family protein, partial [Planctomycetota bacterium]
MFELRVRRKFSAAHAITMAGQVEALHGHDWRVSVRVRGERLDGDGLLCD